MGSWRPCQSHSVEQSSAFDKEEKRSQFLEATALSKFKKTINPYGFHLAQIEWAIFGGLSWRQDSIASGNDWADGMRQADFYRLIGVTCTRHRLRPRRLLVYGKSEWGNGKRAHFHFLIGKEGLRGVLPAALCKTMLNLWTVEFNNGTAQIESYDWQQHLDGIFYQSKYEFDQTGNEPCISETFSYMLRKRMTRNGESQELSIM